MNIHVKNRLNIFKIISFLGFLAIFLSPLAVYATSVPYHYDCVQNPYLCNNSTYYPRNHYVVPTVNLYVDQTSITSGQPVTVSWNSSNANSCYGTGATWSGSKNISGSEIVYPNNTSTYTITCTNSYGSNSASQPVYVTQQYYNPTPVVTYPTVNLYADQTNISSGQPVNLSWYSSNTNSCYAQNAWSGNKNLSGSETIYSYNTSTYTITCTNSYGSNSASQTVYVNYMNQPYPTYSGIPTVNLYLNKSAINSGEYINISWTTTNANSCYATGAWSGYKNNSGSENAYPANTSTYTLTCMNSYGSNSATQTIYVNYVNQQYYTPASQQQGFGAACSVSPAYPRVGNTVTFSAVQSGGIGPYTYSWSGSTYGSSQTVSNEFSSVGTKTATVTIKDYYGNTATGNCGTYISRIAAKQIIQEQIIAPTPTPTLPTPTPTPTPTASPTQAPASVINILGTAGGASSFFTNLIEWYLLIFGSAVLIGIVYIVAKKAVVN